MRMLHVVYLYKFTVTVQVFEFIYDLIICFGRGEGGEIPVPPSV